MVYKNLTVNDFISLRQTVKDGEYKLMSALGKCERRAVSQKFRTGEKPCFAWW